MHHIIDMGTSLLLWHFTKNLPDGQIKKIVRIYDCIYMIIIDTYMFHTYYKQVFKIWIIKVNPLRILILWDKKTLSKIFICLFTYICKWSSIIIYEMW